MDSSLSDVELSMSYRSDTDFTQVYTTYQGDYDACQATVSDSQKCASAAAAYKIAQSLQYSLTADYKVKMTIPVDSDNYDTA